MSQEPLLNAFLKLKRNLLQMTGRLLRDEEDASDVLQEAFCRLWVIRDKIKNEPEASAITIRTTQNICIDRLRRNQRFRACKDVIEHETEILSDFPEKELEIKEKFNLVKEIIDSRLTGIQRTIIKMKEFEDLETDEIARKLNMQETAVRMNLSRARKEIRNHYNRLTNEE